MEERKIRTDLGKIDEDYNNRDFLDEEELRNFEERYRLLARELDVDQVELALEILERMENVRHALQHRQGHTGSS